MTAKLSRSFFLAGTLIAVMPMAVSAQDFFREYGTSRSSGGIGPVMASDYSYEDVSPSGLSPLEEEQDTSKNRNFAIGPIRFSMAAGFGVEFNDNITFSEDDRLSDFVLRPSLNFEADWTISEANTLRFSFGISYAKYLEHSEFDSDSILFAPNTELEYRFGLGTTMQVNIRDRFSYQEDPFDISVLNQVAKYERYENQIGFEAQWTPNANLQVNFGFDHYNLWTTNDIYADQDRAIDTILLKPSYALTQTLRVGLNSTYSFITFDSENRNDGYNFMVGPFVQWEITDATNAFVEAGYQQMTFDDSYEPGEIVDRFLDEQDFDELAENFVRRAATDNDTDNSNYYVRFELNNKPSEFLKHRLSGSKTAEIGFFTNSYDLYHIEYSLDYTGIQKTEISPTLFYEYYETSGQFSEEASRVGATVGVRHYLTNSITVGLDYRFIYKDSNLQGFDYYQNLAFLSLFYKF